MASFTLILDLPDGCMGCCCTPCDELDVDPFPIRVAGMGALCPCPTGTGKTVTALTFDGDYNLALIAPGEWRAFVGSITIEDCGGGSPATGPIEVEILCVEIDGEQKYLINAWDESRGHLLFGALADCHRETTENVITPEICALVGNVSIIYGGTIELRA